MSRTVLLVYAQPEPTSLTRSFVDAAVDTLSRNGHRVLQSDLYGMRWKAVLDADDFPDRADPERLSFIAESGHAYAAGTQPPDVAEEQRKLLAADAVIFVFPLWWYGIPAILKGWFERVYAYGFGYGYQGQGNRLRYGDGLLKGKRALLAAMVGGGEQDYGPRGINGPLKELLFPVTHGCLFYPGMDVLPIHAVYGVNHLSREEVADQLKHWLRRLADLFDEAPIPFRRQNGGDYPDGHQLADDIAPEMSGIWAHVALPRCYAPPQAKEAAEQ
ncbi:NAD(P)H-dependent oxidoreductase [Chromobacterium phragmitis]|uniref:NAD(P)H-dependent oxidoreductase n=1 Tax=Chromobacterium amazonense TaxID=1382803 RepID=UPI0021B812D7|nr:NAD(P)H-dependent oxidoreductase [Chromobacterium amazonense]MBM2885696.1 NAD(P)H-dependent oxidoreductase [Chromobacterium amazonense]MDE1716344.1 NAD(P)H-dependent oxidoreductase [Chromobacterium amazonense]